MFFLKHVRLKKNLRRVWIYVWRPKKLPGVLSGNKDIKQICLIGREAESRWVFDISFATLARTEKPGNQPQQLSDNDNFIDGFNRKPEGNSKPTKHM